MKQKEVVALWSSVGLAGFLLSLDVFLRTTGMEPDLSILGAMGFNKVETRSAGIFGILFGAPMLGVVLYLTRYHLTRWLADTWFDRLPRAFGLGTASDSLGRNYQGLFLLAFLLLPAAGQVHSLIKVLEADVFLGSFPVIESSLGHFSYRSIPDVVGHLYRHQSQNGVQYYPFYEPWLFTVVVIYLLAELLRVLWLLFLGLSQRS